MGTCGPMPPMSATSLQYVRSTFSSTLIVWQLWSTTRRFMIMLIAFIRSIRITTTTTTRHTVTMLGRQSRDRKSLFITTFGTYCGSVDVIIIVTPIPEVLLALAQGTPPTPIGKTPNITTSLCLEFETRGKRSVCFKKTHCRGY